MSDSNTQHLPLVFLYAIQTVIEVMQWFISFTIFTDFVLYLLLNNRQNE